MLTPRPHPKNAAFPEFLSIRRIDWFGSLFHTLLTILMVGFTAFLATKADPGAQAVAPLTMIGLFIVGVMMFAFVGGTLMFHLAIIQNTGQHRESARAFSDPVQSTLDRMPEGLLTTDPHDRIVLVNESFAESVGVSRERLVGRRVSSLSWIRNSAAGRSELPWARAVKYSERQEDQLMRYRHPTCGERVFSISASPIHTGESTGAGALVTFRDVTLVETHRAELEHSLIMLRHSRDEMHVMNRRLQVLADEDPLTGCLNRRSLFERFQNAWSGAEKCDVPLTCLMLDVDHFKQVNDDYGHPVGDDVLKNVATVLNQSFVEPSVVGRYGGEEFCVMMPGATSSQGSEHAERARQEIERIAFRNEPKLKITVSIGVASRSPGVNQIEDLIRQADECLYQAKEGGRNRVVDRDHYLKAAEVQADKLEPTSVR